MITMARIEGFSMGFRRPQLGQNSFQSGPTGAGVTPPAVPAIPEFPTFVYPPNYAYLTQEVPVPTPAPAPSSPLPTWAIVGMSLVAGAAVTALVLTKK